MDTLHALDYTQTLDKPLVDYNQPLPLPAENSELALMKALQRSLEIDIVLQIFAQYAAKIVRLSYLRYTFQDNSWQPLQQPLKARCRRCFNLMADDQPLGQLEYGFVQQPDSAAIRRLVQAHSILAWPLRNALSYYQMQQLALQDGLTGLRNRASFDTDLRQQIERARRNRQGLTLVLLDLDNFKQVNDNFGHQQGDAVIQVFANLCRNAIRQSDTAYRFGGDEFALLLEGGNVAAVRHIYNRLRLMMKNHPLLSRYQITTSVGAAQLLQDDSAEQLFNRADQALYQAKAQGRNTLVCC